MLRATLNPQTFSPAGKLKLLKGIANSATHPCCVRRVRTLQEGQQGAGQYQIQWDGRDPETRTGPRKGSLP